MRTMLLCLAPHGGATPPLSSEDHVWRHVRCCSLSRDKRATAVRPEGLPPLPSGSSREKGTKVGDHCGPADRLCRFTATQSSNPWMAAARHASGRSPSRPGPSPSDGYTMDEQAIGLLALRSGSWGRRSAAGRAEQTLLRPHGACNAVQTLPDPPFRLPCTPSTRPTNNECGIRDGRDGETVRRGQGGQDGRGGEGCCQCTRLPPGDRPPPESSSLHSRPR